MEACIGLDDPDEQHVGEVETFGDHLGAEQDFCASGSKVRQSPFVASWFPHGIGVHSGHGCIGKAGLDFEFESLGSESREADSIEGAFRALLGSGDGVVAVVAHGFVPIAVESQRQVAIWAGEDEATGWTLNTGRVTATVEQQDDLSVFLVQDTVHGLQEGFRQATLVDIDAVDA